MNTVNQSLHQTIRTLPQHAEVTPPQVLMCLIRISQAAGSRERKRKARRAPSNAGKGASSCSLMCDEEFKSLEQYLWFCDTYTRHFFLERHLKTPLKHLLMMFGYKVSAALGSSVVEESWSFQWVNVVFSGEQSNIHLIFFFFFKKFNFHSDCTTIQTIQTHQQTVNQTLATLKSDLKYLLVLM